MACPGGELLRTERLRLRAWTTSAADVARLARRILEHRSTGALNAVTGVATSVVMPSTVPARRDCVTISGSASI